MRWPAAILRLTFLLALGPLLIQGAGAALVAMPPMQETLVEGHTVYTVLNAAHSAPAVAASSDGGAVAADSFAVREVREPGVLWFNDQYLVNPSVSVNVGDGVVEDERHMRSAGGVAVLALRPDGSLPCGGAVLAVNDGDPDPRLALPAPRVDLDGAPVARAALPDAWSYQASYLVTDPLNQVWIIDKFLAATRTEAVVWSPLDAGVFEQAVYVFPVFVVDLQGGAFVPDIDTCVGTQPQGLRAATCAAGGAPPPLPGSVLLDDPCAGYAEPSAGFCYNGVQAHPLTGCATARVDVGERAYNALLYLPFDDLFYEARSVDHGVPEGTTNGCAAGTRWTCPAGDDDREGRSHGFAPPFALSLSSLCVDGGANHGGWAGTCVPVHETRRIDLYYSAQERPPAPAQRTFAKLDRQGSGAPWGPDF